jgi:hypothetical protein
MFLDLIKFFWSMHSLVAPYIYKALLEDMACAQELNTAIQITFYIKGSSDSKIVLAKEDCG